MELAKLVATPLILKISAEFRLFGENMVKSSMMAQGFWGEPRSELDDDSLSVWNGEKGNEPPTLFEKKDSRAY